MNPDPITLVKSSTAYSYFNSRTSSYDAALTTQASKAFTVKNKYGGWNVTSFDGTKIVNVTKFTVRAKRPVKVFDDYKGYYPGFFRGAPCTTATRKTCYWNLDGSAVIPADGNYTVRSTTYAGKPMEWTQSWNGFEKGSGNPGDKGVNWGVKVQLLARNAKGTTALLRFSYTK